MAIGPARVDGNLLCIGITAISIMQLPLVSSLREIFSPVEKILPLALLVVNENDSGNDEVNKNQGCGKPF